MFAIELFENDDMFSKRGQVTESEDDAFASSKRVARQIEQDRHPLHEYLNYEDYESLILEFADALDHTHKYYEVDAYLEELARHKGFDPIFNEIVEDWISGRFGSEYGNKSPGVNEGLIEDLYMAFRRTWTTQKPRVTVHHLTHAMARACVAAIQTSDPDYDVVDESDDDMFAPTRSVGGRYWGLGLPDEYQQLWERLVPASGEAETLEGELLRAAMRLYYQYFNNGFGNNVSGAENYIRRFAADSMQLRNALDAIHPYTRCDTEYLNHSKQEEQKVEIALDIIFSAVFNQVLTAQGNYHPSPGDMFGYAESDDNIEQDDDEWDDEDDEEDEEDNQ